MGVVDKEELAAHIATTLDGNWDDGLNAYVETMVERGGNTMRLNLRGDGGDLLASFDIVVIQTR